MPDEGDSTDSESRHRSGLASPARRQPHLL